MFLLGSFPDRLETALVVVPLVAPIITMGTIYRGIIPFVLLQLPA